MTDANAGRERILTRLRAARAAAPPLAPPSAACAAGVFAPIADPLVRFQEECAANRTELYQVEAANAATCLGDLLAQALAPGDGAPAYVQDAPILRRLLGALPPPLPARLRWSSEAAIGGDAGAAVTLAEALVVRTGSILVSTACGGRAASVLAPVHIVYAEAAQLVPELDQALVAARARAAAASMLCLITGPSRTSDIEKKLVLGAHGPRRLVLLLAR